MVPLFVVALVEQDILSESQVLQEEAVFEVHIGKRAVHVALPVHDFGLLEDSGQDSLSPALGLSQQGYHLAGLDTHCYVVVEGVESLLVGGLLGPILE